MPRQSSSESDAGLLYETVEATAFHRMIFPVLMSLLQDVPPGSRVLDMGCGAGVISGWLLEKGFDVTGVDISGTGIDLARTRHRTGRFLQASTSEPGLKDKLGGGFDAIVCIDVIEHVGSTAKMLANCRALLRANGILIVSTPYHGYLKNLVLSVVNGWDAHWAPGHEGGHVKFWSVATLSRMLGACGFVVKKRSFVGRMPFLWKSMIMSAVKL